MAGCLRLLCQVFIWCTARSTSVTKGDAPILRRELYTSGATNAIGEVDADGDHMIVSECSDTQRGTLDFAECRSAAKRLGLSFHIGAPSAGCRRCRDPLGRPVVTFNGSFTSLEKGGTPLCVSHSLRMNLRMEQLEYSSPTPESLKVFCFAWTTWKLQDVALLEEVRHSMKHCDGYRIFSDRQPPVGANETHDVVMVTVPEQQRAREDDQWLYHRNMAGLIPSWSYLLQASEVEIAKYDWLINVEFDHFLRTTKLRGSIASYLSVLRKGRPEQRQAAEGPLMLMFGNAFLFNQLMVKEMQRQWLKLSATAPPGHEASGCPEFMEGRFEWPAACSQDIVYPNMVTVMDPPVAAYGSPGCGQKPQDFPLACFELQRQPVQELALDQSSLIRRLAETSPADGTATLAEAKDVPLFHHLSDPLARKLARELLP